MTIRNDATRIRIAPKDKRRPRAVVSRQGQVLLDTDFDQQSRHEIDRIEVETQDVLGSPHRLVVPAGNTGFSVTPSGAPANFDIGAGHGYLDGWLLENMASCKLATQPHPRAGDAVAPQALIVVKSLIRHVDPVEETMFVDTALGDAQASGRSLVDWQVLPLALTGGAAATCATALTNPDFVKLSAPSTGTLAVIPQTAAPSPDPCSLTPGGGYTRLENLLYRFEAHNGVVNNTYPVIDGPRFNLDGLKVKFSRRNASVMVRITNITGVEITVVPPVLDTRNWFAPGLFAEIVSLHDDVDPRAALANERLFRVALARDDRVTLEATSAQVAATGAALDGTWFLRLWDAYPDGTGIATVSAPGGASDSAVIDLGDGLTIVLSGGTAATFRRGDYWTTAARADGTVDWPTTGGVADKMAPHGPETRYAPIAALSGPPGAPVFEDCRIPFATLTDRVLLYRGGDGQCAFSGATSGMVALDDKLRVAVMRGETPVAGAQVRWSFVAPAGGQCQINGVLCNAANSPETLTDADGLAEVTWSLDSSQQLVSHQVQAALVTGAGPSKPPIVFSAAFETAKHTSYTPGCSLLSGIDNVQDAIDKLCNSQGKEFDTIRLVSIRLLATGQDLVDSANKVILNGLEVTPTALAKGVLFLFNPGPDSPFVEIDPVAEIGLDLPYPTSDPDKLYWATASTMPTGGHITGPFGFQHVRLEGFIGKQSNGFIWRPSDQVVRLLQTEPQHHWGGSITPDFVAPLKNAKWPEPRVPRVLCRIRLRSALIWAGKPRGERIYLNAEYLGTAIGVTGRELDLDVRDPQRAADLDMFIYLSQ